MDYSFRIFDFQVYNSKQIDDNSSDEERNKYQDTGKFEIQMFGLNEKGETASIKVTDYKPFFYLLVNDSWTIRIKTAFLTHLKEKIGNYYKDGIHECKLIKKRKLYGFDAGKEHKFIKLEFHSMTCFNKVKNLWYSDYKKGHKLFTTGYSFYDTDIMLYEANIPPLLRFFHIKEISPSGWIALPKKKCIQESVKNTTCNYEIRIHFKDIVPLNDKETRVPYKICSFDIEASSSHGDFPVPVKTYKRLATNIIDVINKQLIERKEGEIKLNEFIYSAFQIKPINEIDTVYPKTKVTKKQVDVLFNKWINSPMRDLKSSENLTELLTIEKMFEKSHEDDDDTEYGYNKKEKVDDKYTILDILFDKTLTRETKINETSNSLNAVFPKLEGDKVTFIGSTFMTYGEKEPNMNHCIALNTCKKIDGNNTIIESYKTEKEVLLAWQKVIQKEDPDIIIGYNIFGFDYQFLFKRAEENNCVEQFLKLSRNKDEICGNKEGDSSRYKLEESSIVLASGQHDLHFIKMNGRLQVDLYNFYRRESNLTSYKLDYVAGHFIGDMIKKYTYDKKKKETKIETSNMTGLLQGSYIHIEEIGHSTEFYQDGAKFMVAEINKEEKYFCIKENITPDDSKKLRWCLAKDDVTPKDIFRLSNGSAEDRGIVAKYCIQDCNLVHYLFNKSDILTGFIEMATICSVPISFLVMRGQGIKLTSYIAKKCREKNTLMPVIEKGAMDEGYEGAIVLDPKCDLYLDNPVACVDYASLYPSSMISENLSHDSKVWIKEYDLENKLIKEIGEKDEEGNFIYDNLPEYEYVDVTYDAFKYVRKTPSAAAEKVKCGHRICRFAQFPEGKAIMPSILEELLKARKSTRKLIPQQTDDFMKQVLEQRQLGYKLTANSLYGQCGAKTSTFYEKDIAACTTATGRLLLTYAKRLIEETYGDKICNTENHGPVLTKAEYIYGDSVANYTPIFIRNGSIIENITIEHLAAKYGDDKWITCKEKGKQEKEFCELNEIETWTENGWTKLYRIIRHKLAHHKKMIRIITHTGVVDVTDDHSLITKDGYEISPNDVSLGTELLHFTNPYNNEINSTISKEEARILGFFFGDGSCGSYDCTSGKKHSWALNNASEEMIIYYQQLCSKVYPDMEWVIMPTLESSGVYKLSPKSSKYGSIVSFVKKFREQIYYEKSKIIPSVIFQSNEEIRSEFFKGLYDADGDKDKNGYTRIDQKNQISASHISWLAQTLGWSVSLNTRKDKQDIYRITMTRNKQRKNPYAIKKMTEIEYNGFVYDLTTDNHHFAAGVGNMIVHNTDSVFFTFNLETPEGEPIRGKKALEITIELAQEAGHLASKFLKGPHDLEYEKTFMPFCLLSKKRYVGILYEHDPNKGKRKEMGIVLKRRDNAPIVKDVYGGIIDILMKDQNIENAIAFLKGCLQNIIDEKYPMEKLIITKSLRSNYKNPNSIAHKVLSDRITERDPGNKPSSGDRIPYVYVVNPNKKALQGEKIETPSYILENKIKIDYSFYITNQIMKPVQQVFALVLEKIWINMKKIPKVKRFRQEIETLRKNTPKEKFEAKLEQLKNKEVKALLFDSYIRDTNNAKEGNKSINSFFTSSKNN